MCIVREMVKDEMSNNLVQVVSKIQDQSIILDIFTMLCLTVRYLHSKNLFLYELEPENIYVCPSESDSGALRIKIDPVNLNNWLKEYN